MQVGVTIKIGQLHRLVLMLTEIIFAIAGGHQGDVIQVVMI